MLNQCTGCSKNVRKWKNLEVYSAEGYCLSWIPLCPKCMEIVIENHKDSYKITRLDNRIKAERIYRLG